MKKYMELGNRTVEEAKNDLRPLNDPTSLSYNDNWVAKALRDKYGMSIFELANIIKKIEQPVMMVTLSKMGWFDELAGLSEAGLVIGEDFDIKFEVN